MSALAGYDETTFTFEGKTRTVFRRGSGPAVLVITEIPGITPLVANVIAWLSRQKPSPWRHAIFGIGGVSDGKYATIFSLSHIRDSLSKVGALVVPTLLGLGPYPEVFDENGAPNEPSIQWKVGQMVRELTHFSRGGI